MAILLQDSGLSKPLKTIASYFGNRDFIDLFEANIELRDAIRASGVPEGIWPYPNPSTKTGLVGLGQLSIKEEAAGKVRVFALVDIWTQSVLKPVHQTLFSYLKSLPNDGTFDQHASVKRCFEKSEVAQSSFGYDLSAATDRLPISLQVAVLSALFGTEIAAAWKELLVDRDYVLTDKKYGSHTVRYSVGQPMGALSS